MKRSVFIAIIVAAALLLAFVIQAAASSASPFIGRWEATDVDGSNLEMMITWDGWSGNRLVDVRGSDDRTGTWWCGGLARNEGLGVIREGNSLETTGAWWCVDPVENVLFALPGYLTYDGSTDTITDGTVVWHRAP